MAYGGWRRGLGAGVGLALAMAAVACSGDDDGVPKGSTVGSGDTYEATIRRVEGGVPHIVGDSLADVTFGQGWASGEDRTCDLADQVLKIRGERAATFGPGEDDANVDSDIAWRAVGIFDKASEDWKQASKRTREVLTAFVAGWNGHLKEVGVDKVTGWCAGQDWVRPLKPVEVYAYARSIAIYASGGQLLRYIAAAQPPGQRSLKFRGSQRATPVQGTILQRPMASNGWAIGKARSAEEGGLLVANPHFPWEGELRFWESHLEIPGQVDAYGVQLSGLPGIGIGFNQDVGWTHTVSAGNRFTAYKLRLVPGKPTTYYYGGEQREMTKRDITVDVLGEDDKTTEVTRTMWSSHYGPIIDVGADFDVADVRWTTTSALTYRDANIDDDEILDQYLDMVQAEGLDDLIEAHREHQGIPLFNTIAVDKKGRAWYADTSATPNLSPAAIVAFENKMKTDMLTSAAADNGLVLLDGSNPLYEWQDAPGARDPGLIPFDKMPMVERDDYVFNANDSYWLPNAEETIEGDFSPLQGREQTPRSPRTRENAVVLDDVSPEGPSGEDGRFDLDELAAAALRNEGYTARALRDEVVKRCQKTPTASVDGATVDLSDACAVLADWDGRYDLDSRGAVLFREMLQAFPSGSLFDKGDLWATAFDPRSPVDTPSGLAPAPTGGPDPVLVNLATAVQALDKAGLEVDVPLGDVQFALRDGKRIPIHGGNFFDGTTNVVGRGGRTSASILDDAIPDVPGGLDDTDGDPGYGVDNGTSFLLALAFTKDGPQAKAFLTYGNTEDRKDPLYTEATERFSRKEWRDVPLTEKAIEEAATSTVTVKG